MENICKMDCHSCTIQEGYENKAMCATLFMPAMFNRLSVQLQRIEAAMTGKDMELNEVILEVKQMIKNDDDKT